MTRYPTALFLSCLLLLPATLQAQSIQTQSAAAPRDIAYCEKLADTYVRYIGHDLGSERKLTQRGDIDAQVAVGKCHKGDTAWAIPILEQQLLANRFTLPQRD